MRIRQAAADGARIVCVQELFRSQYFCREENAALFDLAEPVPGPTTECFSALARELEIAIVGSIFERRTAGVYHNTAVVFDADGSLAGIYRKMHIPDDRSTLKSITSLRATWAFAVSIPGTRESRRWCAGINGIRRPRGWRRWPEPRCCFIPPPSAGTRRKKRNTG